MSQSHPNPLLAILSPRDIRIVIDSFRKLKAPKLWVRYMIDQPAYDTAHNFFREHKEFTHLAIVTDDVLINQEQYDILLNTLTEYNYPVLSGVMNVSYRYRDLYNICISSLPSPYRDLRRYNFLQYNQMKKLNTEILKVKFSGFPLMFIRRDVLDKIKFESDIEWNPDAEKPEAFDVTFCYRCDQLSIPIYANTSVILHHLREAPATLYPDGPNVFYINKRDPEVIFESCPPAS